MDGPHGDEDDIGNLNEFAIVGGEPKAVLDRKGRGLAAWRQDDCRWIQSGPHKPGQHGSGQMPDAKNANDHFLPPEAPLAIRMNLRKKCEPQSVDTTCRQIRLELS
ncbi:hypothetical protein MPLDJ20_150170 [Mesorhizobium plurifarium]|uniref:Uncharacterized protein n=1 Tax=Mesorhizobium plurifarium TaxID=69974 RepID=A0A090GIT6_MESPL|nr:hypothetical protein MPLDJ20_150170 [Mesorhizobium plurifarium]